MKNKYTIVIQGKLHQNSIVNLNNYYKIGNVVYSCWMPKVDNRVSVLFEGLFSNKNTTAIFIPEI